MRPSTAASIRTCRCRIYCELFSAIRTRYGSRLEFYALTIAEFLYLADHARLTLAEAAQQLKAAGVRWITGGGSEILTEDFRKRHAKFKYTVAAYFEAQRAILEAGLRTTATMVIGFDETLDERLEHLERTRAFQDKVLAEIPGTRGLESFLCWTYKPYFTQIGGIEISNCRVSAAPGSEPHLPRQHSADSNLCADAE